MEVVVDCSGSDGGDDRGAVAVLRVSLLLENNVHNLGSDFTLRTCFTALS